MLLRQGSSVQDVNNRNANNGDGNGDTSPQTPTWGKRTSSPPLPSTAPNRLPSSSSFTMDHLEAWWHTSHGTLSPHMSATHVMNEAAKSFELTPLTQSPEQYYLILFASTLQGKDLVAALQNYHRLVPNHKYDLFRFCATDYSLTEIQMLAHAASKILLCTTNWEDAAPFQSPTCMGAITSRLFSASFSNLFLEICMPQVAYDRLCMTWESRGGSDVKLFTIPRLADHVRNGVATLMALDATAGHHTSTPEYYHTPLFLCLGQWFTLMPMAQLQLIPHKTTSQLLKQANLLSKIVEACKESSNTISPALAAKLCDMAIQLNDATFPNTHEYDHIKALNVNLLGEAYLAGEFKTEAIAAFRRYVEIERQNYQRDPALCDVMAVTDSMHELALLLTHSPNHYAEAEQLCKTALVMQKDTFFRSQPLLVLESLYWVGYTLKMQKKMEEAIHYFRDAFLIKVKIHNDNQSPEVLLDDLLSLAKLSEEVGNYQDAEMYWMDVLDIYTSHKNHAEEATALRELSRLSKFLGNLDNELRYSLKAVHADVAAFGERSQQVASDLTLLSSIYAARALRAGGGGSSQDNKDAIESDIRLQQSAAIYRHLAEQDLLKRHLEDSDRQYGEFITQGYGAKDAPIQRVSQLFEVTNRMAQLKRSLGHEDALEFAYQALRLEIRVKGANHHDVIEESDRLANIYFIKKQYDKALALFTSAAENATDDRVAAAALYNWARSLEVMQKPEEADGKYRASLERYGKLQTGETYIEAEMLQVMRALFMCMRGMGYVDDAVEEFVRHIETRTKLGKDAIVLAMARVTVAELMLEGSRGLGLRASQQCDVALTTLTTLVSRSPQEAMAHKIKSKAALRCGDDVQAWGHAEMALELLGPERAVIAAAEIMVPVLVGRAVIAPSEEERNKYLAHARQTAENAVRTMETQYAHELPCRDYAIALCAVGSVLIEIGSTEAFRARDLLLGVQKMVIDLMLAGKWGLDIIPSIDMAMRHPFVESVVKQLDQVEAISSSTLVSGRDHEEEEDEEEEEEENGDDGETSVAMGEEEASHQSPPLDADSHTSPLQESPHAPLRDEKQSVDGGDDEMTMRIVQVNLPRTVVDCDQFTSSSAVPDNVWSGASSATAMVASSPLSRTVHVSNGDHHVPKNPPSSKKWNKSSLFMCFGCGVPPPS